MVYDEDEPLFPDLDPEVNHLNEMYPNLFSNSKCQYYDMNSFNNLQWQSSGTSDLSILHVNIRSLGADSKMEQVGALLHFLNRKFHILCFTESWLTESNKDLYSFDGYVAYHCLRSDGRRGGGISVFVTEEFDVRSIPDCTVSLPHIESLFLGVTYGDKLFNVGTFYRPPQGDNQAFIREFELILSALKVNSRDCFLCGDFNFDFLKSSDSSVVSFSHVLSLS